MTGAVFQVLLLHIPFSQPPDVASKRGGNPPASAERRPGRPRRTRNPLGSEAITGTPLAEAPPACPYAYARSTAPETSALSTTPARSRAPRHRAARPDRAPRWASRKEPALFARRGGKPTVVRLRHRGPTNPVTLACWHSKLSKGDGYRVAHGPAGEDGPARGRHRLRAFGTFLRERPRRHVPRSSPTTVSPVTVTGRPTSP
jgi:hypothetical protein